MTGTLMGYPQTSSGVVGNTSGGLSYDSVFGRVYGVAPGSGTTDGIRMWDAYPFGNELRARNIGDIGITSISTHNTFTLDSNELIENHDSANSEPLYGFSRWDLSFTSTFGAISSSLSPSTSSRILCPKQMCSWQFNGQDCVVSVSLTASPAEISCLVWPNKYNYPATITQTFAVAGAVPDGSGSQAYVAGFNQNNTAIAIYAMTAPGNLTQLGTLLPATIDATWTNVTNVYGITIDQTDGNLIMGFATTDAVTNKAYLCKLSKINGGIMWKVAVGAGITYNIADMPKNVVKTGTLYYLTGQTLYTINTKTGASSTSALNTATLDGINPYQISEDVSGSIFWYGSWSDGGTAPSYIGTFCGVQGNHSGASMPWRFWPSSPITNVPVYGAPASSRKRAWFFVLDGHEMYVLDLGQEGTWIYDRSTNHWCQFITQGYVQWNFANGCMWGQRIVAGDLLTTEVWEMQPGLLFDNGATEIQHVVTGGVATRNRTYHSVDSFRLACSSGLYTDTTGAGTVTLSFSDDQGNTFTTMDTYSLPAGKFSQEFLWTSLGSFAAPGRIFRITDTGGFLRIEGADAGIDGFDPITGDEGSEQQNG